ncbi:diaminopimelate epimerase [Pikeienuella piscinae]|uniref:Diaminopimelate epimerase n=1 Tax=Pikeienuella piscinae TaxID=2748098 RepID=A0A7L5BXN8_9RHOB|nr:diaminopimelate epimerase [Pikeienuella piscinae]QIE54369.1 diaminopimelate epimerase [Pikeienuella piscinae]
MKADEHPAALAFGKMHGLGNDFVVIDARGRADPMNAMLAEAIADRHRGVGFDQLAVILSDDESDARLVFWNADGSTAGACGNATRCVASRLMTESGRDRLTLRTERGILACALLADGRVRVDMGAPLISWRDVPLARAVDTDRLPLAGGPAACSMGNPHCTFFVDDADAPTLSTRGPEVEYDPLFPERTNVQFVQVLDRNRARVRVWERGVGVTLASGSSSCAVLVNAVRRGLMDRRATLILDGGEIEVEWPEGGGVLMTGPVMNVFEGVFTPGFLAAAR